MTIDRTYTIQVNGDTMEIEGEKQTAGDILALARRHNAISGDPHDYILKGENREYAWDETVDVSDDKNFIAIPNTPTPVA